MRNLAFAVLCLGALAQTVGCGEEADDIEGGEGQFELDWVLTDGVNPISCGDAGADGVSVLTTLQGGQGVDDIFSCTDGGAVTDSLPLGSYTVVVSILEVGTDDVLGASAPRSGALTEDGELKDLGVFEFDFGGGTAPGDVTFSVDYDVAGGTANCGGGLEVEDQETTLRAFGGGTCIPTELAAGADGVANICDEFPICIDSSVEQTLVQVAAGEYEIVLQGLFTNGGSSTACYSVLVPVTVDGDQDLGTILVPFDDAKDPDFCMSIPQKPSRS